MASPTRKGGFLDPERRLDVAAEVLQHFKIAYAGCWVTVSLGAAGGYDVGTAPAVISTAGAVIYIADIALSALTRKKR